MSSREKGNKAKYEKKSHPQAVDHYICRNTNSKKQGFSKSSLEPRPVNESNPQICRGTQPQVSSGESLQVSSYYCIKTSNYFSALTGL